MFRLCVKVLILLLCTILALAAVSAGKNVSKSSVGNIISQEERRVPLDLYKTLPKARLAGNDAGPGEEPGFVRRSTGDAGPQMRGVFDPAAGIGIQIGKTSYDYQHNGRCTRMVSWWSTHDLSFAWMKKNITNPEPGVGYRMTAHEFWDVNLGSLTHDIPNFVEGADLHGSLQRSGYVGCESMHDGRAMPYNHFDPDGVEPYEYRPNIWPTKGRLSVDFGYKEAVPDSLLGASPGGTDQFIWPYACFQLYDNGTSIDTIVHIVGRESTDASTDEIRYFRRKGGPHPDGPAHAWDDYMTVDTSAVIGYVVEAAPPYVDEGYEGKVAIVWISHLPATPGGSESTTPENISLLVEQNFNDVYYRLSMNGGETWGSNVNITRTDSTVGGWVPLSDVSAVIESDGDLHIVYAARPFVNEDGIPQSVTDMDWTLFPIGSRILHWSDADPTPEYITIIKNYMADWTDYDSICIGGAWSSMGLTKPMISECAGRLYVIWAQYQAVDKGLWDDCHITAWTENRYSGSANAQLYFSVSDNNGRNWDPARMLTGFTQRCDTADSPESDVVCHSHGWPSMTRWGMDTTGTGDDFDNAVIVKGDGWTHTDNGHFLDIAYLNDLWPGGVIQGEGMWTFSPFQWFRLPCVDIIEEPVLAYDPAGVFVPSWGKPGDEEIVDVTLLNIGNTDLVVSDIRAEELNNADPAYNGWLTFDDNDFDLVSYTIDELVPDNYHVITLTINTDGKVNETNAPAVLTGRIIYDWSTAESDTMNVTFIVADTVQEPESDTLFTNAVSLSINNAGAVGNQLYDSLGQMDFHSVTTRGLSIDCDTCDAVSGNNNSECYLYDAAPYVIWHDGEQFRISTYIHSHGWLSDYRGVTDGLRPQEGTSGVQSAYDYDEEPPVEFANYVESGVYYNADSTIGMHSTFIAPYGDYPDDTNSFIVEVVKFFNMTESSIDLYAGAAEDWDIPSDSGVRNTSYYDITRKLMYLSGFETVSQPDTFCGGFDSGESGNNDCADANKRFGGSAFFGGYHKSSGDGIGQWQGAFTAKTVNWLHDFQGHLQPDSLYAKLSGGFSGYEPWEADDPEVGMESVFQDLVLISSYGQFSLGVNDTLVFAKILASEYQGGLPGLQGTIDEANAFTLEYLCCEIWGMPGDANIDRAINILDIVFTINYKYKGGDGVPWPDDEYGEEYNNCDAIMDTNADGDINILDIVYTINYKYKGGPDPKCAKGLYTPPPE